MKTLTSLLLLSCVLPSMGQDLAPYGSNDRERRIDDFAAEVKQALRPIDGAASHEGACAEFERISAKARELASEVRAERGRLPNPAVGLAYTSALAADLHPTHPQASTFLSWYGTREYVNTKASHAEWFPLERLEDISYFASEADKARTTKRMSRMQEKLLLCAEGL